MTGPLRMGVAYAATASSTMASVTAGGSLTATASAASRPARKAPLTASVVPSTSSRWASTASVRATAPSTNASVASTPSTVKLSATASTAPLRAASSTVRTSGTSSPPVRLLTITAGFQLKPPPASRTVASKSAPRPLSAGTRGADMVAAVSAMGSSSAGPNSARRTSAASPGVSPPIATPSTEAWAGSWLPATK